MRIDLSGKTAVVTGGSGGIGRAICVQLASAGAEVVFTYFSDKEQAQGTLQQLEDIGRPGAMIKCNLADQASTVSIVADLRQRTGTVDLFISNAASGVLKPTTELHERHWQWCMDVNARALLRIVQGLTETTGEVASLMPDGGRIVALSSLGAHRVIPGYGAVGASKAALESLARHLAYDLGPRGITVNTVSPGIVETRALDYFPNKDKLIDVATRKTRLGRLTAPADVAHAVAFLCSDYAGMISGQTIVVDGGYASVA